MPEEMSPARMELMNESAKRIRTAIDRRDELLGPAITKFDNALEHGDKAKIESMSAILIALSSPTFDPVNQEIKNWVQLDGMLKRAESGVASE